ncbi:hypothetical protein DNTS_011114 [Danionella cerebrum]|uniref:Tissue factor n=1 Tax=Danionella cerebrum TaxID=2873325 RepID=A0A553MMC8_9TELE|nr:hypothetical protein DNTS_011114 [Danionella translucida]
MKYSEARGTNMRLGLSTECAVLTCTFLFVISENVPVPENVNLISENMGLLLEWDPPQNTSDVLVNYTAELKGWKAVYEPVCSKSSSLQCDFTNSVAIYGTYQLRVRTELQGDTSDWVETEVFSVDEIKDTHQDTSLLSEVPTLSAFSLPATIGPPHVELRSSKGQTEVDITDPLLKKKNLRDIFGIGSIFYLVRFWKKGAGKEELKTQQNRVILPQLEPLVNYCVEVEIAYMKNKTSRPSNVSCLTNTASNEAQAWFISALFFISCLVVLVSVVMIFLAVWYGYKLYRNIFPNDKLPEVLKQNLVSRCPAALVRQEFTETNEPFFELRIYEGKL